MRGPKQEPGFGSLESGLRFYITYSRHSEPRRGEAIQENKEILNFFSGLLRVGPTLAKTAAGRPGSRLQVPGSWPFHLYVPRFIRGIQGASGCREQVAARRKGEARSGREDCSEFNYIRG